MLVNNVEGTAGELSEGNGNVMETGGRDACYTVAES